jgi:signal peptidase II
LNDGALFGMGKGLVPLFVLASLLAVGFILYLFACSHYRQRFLHVALGCILAGALGNLFDRTFMRADRIVVRADGDSPDRHFLARIVEDRGGEELRVGSWPDGGRPRSYRREELVEPPRSIGVVRDFIKISPIAGREIWPWIFNVADALLVVGVAMLLLGLAFERRAAGAAVARDSASVAAT